MVENNLEVATLGGGCFWCLEAVYEHVPGVKSVVSGYCGGQKDNPTYREICSGTTGHAEVVKIAFDPEIVSYEKILKVFFVIHDPTTLNRQGSDQGTQYRSVIFFHSGQQRITAHALIDRLVKEGLWDAPVVTEIQPAPVFFAAEDYHQHYFERNPDQAYCQLIVAPKVAKFRKQCSAWMTGHSDSGPNPN